MSESLDNVRAVLDEFRLRGGSFTLVDLSIRAKEVGGSAAQALTVLNEWREQRKVVPQNVPGTKSRITWWTKR